MVKVLILLLSISLLTGCATVCEKYSITKTIDGKKIEVDVLKIKGIGKGKYADGAEIEGKPMIQFPTLPKVEIDK